MRLPFTIRLAALLFFATVFAAPSAAQVISSNVRGVQDVAIVDVNGDGALDVLTASSFDASFRLFSQDATKSSLTFNEVLIDGGVAAARAVGAADVTGDTDVDLFVASRSDDVVYGYLSSGGAAPTFARFVLTTAVDGPVDVHTVDLDADGDTDLVVAGKDDGTVWWFENDGLANGASSFTGIQIASGVTGVNELAVADVNGDGSLDVVAAASGKDAVEAFVSDGAVDPSFSLLPVANGVDVRSLHVIDVNGDGALDVVTALAFTNTVAWFENDGVLSPTFAQRSIDTGAPNVQVVYAADADLDGDVDLFAGSRDDDTAAFYHNTGTPTAPSFEKIVFADLAIDPSDILVSDVNRDGVPEVLVATEGNHTIALYGPGDDGVLPVELTAFDAVFQGTDVQLTWQTATEENNAGFYVERRIGDGAFTALDFLAGRGTTSEPTRYTFTDDTLPFDAAQIAFRLRQVDLDGTATLSPEVVLTRDARGVLVLHETYPNPVRGALTVRYEVPETGRVDLALFNLLGQKVATLDGGTVSAGRAEATLNTSGLASGVYFLRLASDAGVRTQRVTILR